jgi:hypothetical protein
LISRFGPTLTPSFEKALRTMGEGSMTDLVHELGHLRCHVFDVSPECDGG